MLPKQERHSVLETLKRLMGMTWEQVYRDNGLHWEKITSITPPKGIQSIYSIRITRSMRATAYREGNVLRLLTIAPDHDATYGKK